MQNEKEKEEIEKEDEEVQQEQLKEDENNVISVDKVRGANKEKTVGKNTKRRERHDQ